MPPFHAIEGGGRGGLDPRRARLARIHDIAILLLAASVGAFILVWVTFALNQWGPGIAFLAKGALGLLASAAVASVAAVYMVAFMFDADPRTQRERRQLDLDEDEPPPSW